MPSRRVFAAICFFPEIHQCSALEKSCEKKTYGRRLSQDISHSLHMDRQRPDHMSALSFGSTFVFWHFTLNSQTEVRTQGLLLKSFS